MNLDLVNYDFFIFFDTRNCAAIIDPVVQALKGDRRGLELMSPGLETNPFTIRKAPWIL